MAPSVAESRLDKCLSDDSRTLRWVAALFHVARASADDSYHVVCGLSSTLTLRFPRLYLSGGLIFSWDMCSGGVRINHGAKINLGRGPIFLLLRPEYLLAHTAANVIFFPRASMSLGSPARNDRIWFPTRISCSLLPNSGLFSVDKSDPSHWGRAISCLAF